MNSPGVGGLEKKTSSLIPGRELGLKKKLESLDIHSGDPLGLGLGSNMGRNGMGKATTTGQVLHRDLKPENSECWFLGLTRQVWTGFAYPPVMDVLAFF